MTETPLPKLDWLVVFNRAAPPGVRGWGRVRAAQHEQMGRALVIAAWGQAFNALLIVYMLGRQAPPVEMILWLASLALLISYMAGHKRKLRGRKVHALPRKTIDRAAYPSLLFGIVWAFPARFFFEHADQGQQLALCTMTATMMAAVAFIFAPVPIAAAAYVVIMGIGVTGMLASAGSLSIASIGPIYTAAMLAMVMLNGRAFLQRACLDIALAEREETVSLLLREYESSDADWLWQTNSRLRFRSVSARFARAIGREAAAIETLSLLDLFNAPAGADPAVRRSLGAARAAIARKEKLSDVVIPLTVGESVKCIQLSGRPNFSRGGRFTGYQGVGSDVSADRLAAERIAHMARHDALTGLSNRVKLLESLDQALAGAAASGRDCAVLLVDLDRFKAINDSLGHMAGDHLLQQVARSFETVISDDMTAGRLGGDEFAIVVPRFESREELEQLCLALVGTLQGPFHYREQRLFVGASIGVALGPSNGGTVEELIRNADLALYRAKDGSGNEIHFYESSLHARVEERRRIELALRSAIDNGEMSLAYQPVVDSQSERICGFEALLRWHNPELGQVAPARFIPLAEETGVLGRVGEWVIRTACREAANWPDDIFLAVNVSPRQLRDPSFIVTLVSALTQAGLQPHRLELEVTESVFLELSATTQKVLEQIQSLGVGLAMDDFGTGYSSLGYLRKAAFDTLKIDRSFVHAISERNPESLAIIRAVVALAGSLGMKTVAEGVATAEQRRLVQLLGCDRMQGYFYSRPVAGADVKTLLGESGHSAVA
ncbi:MAG TPA: EAL domain-containing protein [Allosphingosinicella sp.]|nr:EAL domain-containing protein [Allosphingosinicella sp.]